MYNTTLLCVEFIQTTGSLRGRAKSSRPRRQVKKDRRRSYRYVENVFAPTTQASSFVAGRSRRCCLDTLYKCRELSTDHPFLCKTKPILCVFHPKTPISRKNKPNSNPIQSQFNPKQTQFKPISKPNKPNSKSIHAGYGRGEGNEKTTNLEIYPLCILTSGKYNILISRKSVETISLKERI